jgi:signal peptidase I
MGTDATDTRRRSLTAAGFGADVYLFAVLSLAVWVVLPTLVLGWSPILVSSGSMSPAIEAGDLVLIDEDVPTDPIAPGAIITYHQPGRDPDRLVTHRVRDATDAGSYTTRGDANVVDDAQPVAHDEVVGYARLLVPLLGLPIHWARTGAQPALLAFVGLTGLALALSAASARQDRTLLRWLGTPDPEPVQDEALPATTVRARSAIADHPEPSHSDRGPIVAARRVTATSAGEPPPAVSGELLFSPDRRPDLRDHAADDGADALADVSAHALFGEPSHDRHDPSGQPWRPGSHGGSGWHRCGSSREPSLWDTERAVERVRAPTSTGTQMTSPVPADHRRVDHRRADRGRADHRAARNRRERRAQAARRRSRQPVLFLLLSAALIASGVSLPVTEAGFTAAASNTGNLFATAPGGPPPEPLPPELVLPPLDGQPSFPAGQQPETITFDFPVAGQTTLAGAAEAVLRVRPSTPGNPPRSVEVTLRHGGGEVLASASLEQQGWNRGWTNVTLTLEPDLDVTLQAGDTLTVEIVIRRLEIGLDGGSIVRLPVAVD